MANEKNFCTNVASDGSCKILNCVKLERVFMDFPTDDGKTIRQVGVRISFEYNGESIRLKAPTGDSKLLSYILRLEGVKILMPDGSLVDKVELDGKVYK